MDVHLNDAANGDAKAWGKVHGAIELASTMHGAWWGRAPASWSGTWQLRTHVCTLQRGHRESMAPTLADNAPAGGIKRAVEVLSHQGSQAHPCQVPHAA